MCRSLWQTPAAFTLISTCVPDGCGVGRSTSFRGALKSVTWKLFIASLPPVNHSWSWPDLAGRSRGVVRGLTGRDQWMMAGSVLVRRYGAKLRYFVDASLVRSGAAGAKAAARGRCNRRRRLADRHAFGRSHVRIGHRDRLDQERGIGMRRRGEELLRGSDFAQPAKIHHGDPVAHRFHHSKIMGDEQQRQSKARLHVFQQVQDLSAYRNIERRNRLIADDEFGIEDERARNADALALSAGKFMRQAPDHQRRIESNRGEYLADELLPLFRILDARYHQRLGDDLADAPPRIQRSDRILENKLHAPAHPPQGIALHR